MSVTLGEIIEERNTLCARIAELEAQPAPQGVAEVMHLVERYAESCSSPNSNGWDVTERWDAVNHALTAIMQERDALRADRDMRINHELVLHKVRADLEAHVKLEQDAALISIAAAKEPSHD